MHKRSWFIVGAATLLPDQRHWYGWGVWTACCIELQLNPLLEFPAREITDRFEIDQLIKEVQPLGLAHQRVSQAGTVER